MNLMTPAQFAAAASLARLSEDRAAVARAVLVDGKPYAAAVAPYGWSRQAAYGAILSIRKHWGRYVAARQAEDAAAALSSPASAS
ncbi:hypothetical protein QTI33_32155 [Variovorax sp. J22P271]|uniref:hypothetical protein n=1 Tax=Variovorax davisae TaxID=3053515 RepID=UPI002576E741|nr:hypothetical protein [Variovorax sp. J22P271]MDM0036827.1 hypothetical protein [Variovorax sp. J22P271]